jgi:TM2 domain-containing membrane protein YozV
MEEKIIMRRPPKSPGLAGVLSFFFPFGTGALYNGQIRKAIIFFFTFAFLVTINSSSADGQPFLAFMLAGLYFYQIYDAVHSARAINRKALNMEEEITTDIDEIPKVVQAGSVFWGIVLMILGGILLLANFEVIDYDTIWNFWPVAVILIGLKFIADYYRKNGGTS